MGHQIFHLVGQDATVAQNEVFPQGGHIRGVQEGHARLLGCAVALAVVAAAASGDHVHPDVLPLLAKRHDMLAREVAFVEGVAAVGAQVAVAGKQLAVGEPGAQLEGVDVGDALRPDDAVDMDDRLLPGTGIVSAPKHGHGQACLPAHLIGGVVDHSLLQRNPGLRQSLTRQLQDLQDQPPSWGIRDNIPAFDDIPTTQRPPRSCRYFVAFITLPWPRPVP